MFQHNFGRFSSLNLLISTVFIEPPLATSGLLNPVFKYLGEEDLPKHSLSLCGQSQAETATKTKVKKKYVTAFVCVTLNSPMFRVGFCPGLKYFVLKSFKVGVRPKPPDWFQLCLKELNPCYHQKGWSLPHGKRDEHTHIKTV